ncbi:MAG: VCBS repeat-containing protein [Rhodothermales bacterium]
MIIHPPSAAPGLSALCLCVALGASCVSPPEAAPPSTLGDFVRIAYNNPDADPYLGVGLWAWPLPMDYDFDGDMDLLVSSPDVPFNGLYVFENRSGEAVPVFEPPVRIGDAIRNVQVSFPAGEPDVLVPGAILQDFRTALDSMPAPLFPPDSILKDIVKGRFNQWKRVDYEGDGDLDLLVGVDDWGDYGWDNAFDAQGQWTNGPLHGFIYLVENDAGAYVNRGRLQAAGAPIDVYGAPTPNAADFDGDGDLDLIAGEFVDKLTWFENIGSREAPVYAAGRYLASDAGVIAMDLQMIIPVAVDWDRDGDVDLVVGDEDGRVALIEHTGRVADRMPVFKPPVYFRQKAGLLKFGALVTPVSVDWDDDGDEDLIAGNTAGYIGFIENLDGGDPPRWATPHYLTAGGRPIRLQAGPNGSIQGPAEAKWGYTTLSVADWDGDGRKDLVVNSIWGRVEWYRNAGETLEAARPVQVDWPGAPPKPAWNWWDPAPGTLATQWRTTPAAVDWNRDGLMDLVMLDHEGYLALYERALRSGERVLLPGRRIFHGTNASAFSSSNEARNEAPGPLQLNNGLYGSSGRRKLAIVDWDADGDLDILVNSRNVALLRNDGEVDGIVHFTDMGDLAAGRLAGHTTSPTVVDWNRDGVPDLLVGAEDGHLYYLRHPAAN